MSRSPSFDILPCRTLPEAIQYVLNNNPFEKNNQILKENEERLFEIIELASSNPKKMFSYLQRHFAEHFDIDLHVIGFVDEKFSLIKRTQNEKQRMAFIAFDKQNKIHGSLYTTNASGIAETVFTVDNGGINVDVYLYVMQLNDGNRIVFE